MKNRAEIRIYSNPYVRFRDRFGTRRLFRALPIKYVMASNDAHAGSDAVDVAIRFGIGPSSAVATPPRCCRNW
jgi:hypothetical protein